VLDHTIAPAHDKQRLGALCGAALRGRGIAIRRALKVNDTLTLDFVSH
jgi:hypothetical protein